MQLKILLDIDGVCFPYADKIKRHYTYKTDVKIGVKVLVSPEINAFIKYLHIQPNVEIVWCSNWGYPISKEKPKSFLRKAETIIFDKEMNLREINPELQYKKFAGLDEFDGTCKLVAALDFMVAEPESNYLWIDDNFSVGEIEILRELDDFEYIKTDEQIGLADPDIRYQILDMLKEYI